MGLDMYVYAVPKDTVVSGDQPIVSVALPSPEWDFEIMYWRKHYRLHWWFARHLRFQLEIADECLNLRIRITEDDLSRLREDVECGILPLGWNVYETSVIDDDVLEDLLRFIQLAEAQVRSGRILYYRASY